MQALLMREDFWFVIEDPQPDPITSNWKRGNQKALATIVLFLSDNQMNLVKNVATAKDAWIQLKEYHEKATMTSRVSLLKRICSMNMTEGQEMEKHIFELEELFDRLQCAGQQMDSSLKIAMILRSVPSSYGGLVTALESRKDEDLTIELVKQKLIDEWQRRSEQSENSNESDERAMKAQSKRQEEKVCYYCRKPGHFKRNCRLFKKEQGEQEEDDRAVRAKQVAEAANPICFTVGSRQCKGRWFVDSGCSNHMTSDRSFFDKLDETATVDVILADGSKSKSAGIGEGSVKCFGSDGRAHKILFKDVMYVPNLCSGLLSVRKLTQKGYRVQFQTSRCDVIDPTGKVVAIGEVRENLYELKSEEMTKASFSSGRQRDCQLVFRKQSCKAAFAPSDPTVKSVGKVFNKYNREQSFGHYGQFIQEELQNDVQVDKQQLTKRNELDSTMNLEKLCWHECRCVRN